MNLLSDSIKKLYFKYLIPALGSSMVMSIYTMTDAIVVGKGVGADGLAALNLITPPYCLIMCLGLLFGIGGSVHTSVQKGTGNQTRACRYFTLGLIGLIITIAIIWPIYIFMEEPILRLMGATDILMPYALDYMKYIIIFFPLMALSNFITIYVRADGDPNRAMAGVLCGGVVNVVLDIILVFPVQMGMGGAALASMLGICMQILVCSSHFLSKNNTMRLIIPHEIGSSLLQIIESGLSAFVNELANGFIVCLFNIQILKYCGNTALAVYSVLANCAILFNSLFTGVGQAMQPIISTNFGAGLHDRILQLRKLGYRTVLLQGVIFTLLGTVFPLTVTSVFLKLTPEIAQISNYGIRLYFISFLPMGINVLSAYYLQSTLRSGASLLISLVRNIVFSSILILVLPIFMGGNILWGVMIIDDLLVAIISCFIVFHKSKKEQLKK